MPRNGTLLTFGGVGPDQLTGAGKTWYDEYMAAHNGDSPATYTAYGNASAAVALAALKAAATRTTGTRSSRPSWPPRTCRPSSAPPRSTPTATPVGGSISRYKVETSWPPAFDSIVSVTN